MPSRRIEFTVSDLENGFAVVGVESGIDTSAFATQGMLTEAMANAYATLATKKELANAVLGKTKLYVVSSPAALFAEMYHSSNLAPGDVIMLTSKGTPDFVVIPYDSYLRDEPVIDVTWGEFPETIQVGAIYHLTDNDTTVLAIESGIDTSAFATKEELTNAVQNAILDSWEVAV